MVSFFEAGSLGNPILWIPMVNFKKKHQIKFVMIDNYNHDSSPSPAPLCRVHRNHHP